MLGLDCLLLLGAAVLLLQSSGPKLVHHLLTNSQRSPLVASCYFQHEEWVQTDPGHLVWTTSPRSVLYLGKTFQ